MKLDSLNPNGYPSFFIIYKGENHLGELIKIPSAFVKAYETRLDTTSVYVRREAGKSWRMILVREEGKLFFRIAEWEDLLRHHDIHYGDIMIFFLKGKTEFELLIYSKTTGCPIASRNAMNFKKERIIICDSDFESEEEFFTLRMKRRWGWEHGEPSNAHPHRREFEKCKKSKIPSGIKMEEMHQTTESGGGEEEKVSNIKSGIVNVKAKYPFFETIVSKTHTWYMSVPIAFARGTGMMGRKSIKLCGVDGGEQEVQIVVTDTKGVQMRRGWSCFRKAYRIKTGKKYLFMWVNPNSRVETMEMVVKEL